MPALDQFLSKVVAEILNPIILLLAAVAFVVLYFIFKKENESERVLRDVWYVVGSVVLGGLIIFSFFLWQFLKG